MSIIKDTFFGGAEKKAAKQQAQAIERGQDITRQSAAEAKKAAQDLFGDARTDALTGFQAASDVFRQALPQQANLFQQGNVAAQQSLLAGLPQFQNAILGGQIDLSGLQPMSIPQADFGFSDVDISNLIPVSRAPQPQQIGVGNTISAVLPNNLDYSSTSSPNTLLSGQQIGARPVGGRQLLNYLKRGGA